MPTGRRDAYKAQGKARPTEAMSDQIIKSHRGFERKGVDRGSAALETASLANSMTRKRLNQTTDSNNS